MIKQESHLITMANGDKVHLRQIYTNAKGPVVFFMHGAVENGRIFYTHSNKGLAPFLAEAGFNCFVADLRGRGNSEPKITSESKTGQRDSIVEEIPAMLEFITKTTKQPISYFCAHSWGGVLLNSVLARFPHYQNELKACVYFASKRTIYNNHPSKYLQANLVWYFISPILIRIYGYLPAKRFGFGSDDETRLSHKEGVEWVKRNPWVCPFDGFDYGKALSERALPPTLHIGAVNDKALAQKIDIEAFINESGQGKQLLNMYGKKHNHLIDYDHINILTATEAKAETFQDTLEWFKQHS
ncbi:alpha/beta fold hydrolase [Pseudoalteromonas sp. G4]|uniref:alpha/beta fold hydrolase n=1 Tax=Pseudoalteromonas sp. G4 TaxID=2992761 RepID=UPI00237E6620|nr:alpha/beta fold hydrolase [Pseudoalteromonas sp. G4]MDE3270601.1 alpha/beta fold hydrolase [Pseudoalteromonas sp. G4]